MESRKLQKSVSGSYLITIPKKWMKNENIREGEMVGVSQESDGSLKVVPLNSNSSESKECSFDIESLENSNSLKRKIESCYISGDDVITVTSKKTISPEWKMSIKSSLLYLIGTEVSEELHNKVKIRTIVDPTRFPVKDVIKRMYTIVNGTYSDAMKSLWDNNKDIGQDVISRKDETEKMYRLLLRQLMISSKNSTSAKRSGVEGTEDAIICAIAGRDLWRIGFYSRDIARQSMKIKSDIPETIKNEIAEMQSLSTEMLEDSVASFLMNDFTKADSVVEKISSIRQKDESLQKSILKECKNSEDILTLTTLVRDIRRIASYGAAIADGCQWKCNTNQDVKK